jgi:hypothetical protein
MQDLVRGGNFHNFDRQHRTLIPHDAPAQSKKQRVPASLAILRRRLAAMWGTDFH